MKDTTYRCEDDEDDEEPSRVIFIADDLIVPDSCLDTAEERLGVKLPQSYRAFLRVLGPGHWCNCRIPVPGDLWRLDCSKKGITAPKYMDGHVDLVADVSGVGDSICINSHDPEVNGERAVYYVGHDPFGLGRVEESFEDWCRAYAKSELEQERNEPGSYFQFMEEAVRRDERARSKENPWWRLWKKK